MSDPRKINVQYVVVRHLAAKKGGGWNVWRETVVKDTRSKEEVHR